MAEIFFPKEKHIVSKTDLKGVITYGNELFIQMSGYSEVELIGKPHNLIRHPDMPKIVFGLLWDTLKQGKEINAYVKNKTKNGDYYWVLANVTPSFNHKGKVVGYHSVRRCPTPEATKKVDSLYRDIRNIEHKKGADEAKEYLAKILKGASYEKFIKTI